MKKNLLLFLLLPFTINAQELKLEQAKKIFDLPTECILIEYPNKLGNVLSSEKDLKTPKELRPIFYGCFDWHSAVHGYWSIIKLLKDFPELDKNNEIRKVVNQHITDQNIATEKAFFLEKHNSIFERTYGWAWLLQLQNELNNWEDADAQKWANTLKPLSELLIKYYKEYLPKLIYPIRSGKHDNTAFGLNLAYDYAKNNNDVEFIKIIEENGKRLYSQDKLCNINYEPSGSDFLSPCLEEALFMGKILPKNEYKTWLKDFLPDLFKKNYLLAPGKVSDRTDGQLVHLDGLNFSRASAFYQIAKKLPELNHLNKLADDHFNYSFSNISNDDYMGSHWLGTFALYALKTKQENQ